jgi:hypothetical protein
VLQVEKRIRTRVKGQMEKTQREFFLYEQLRAIRKEIGDEEGRDEFAEIEVSSGVKGQRAYTNLNGAFRLQFHERWRKWRVSGCPDPGLQIRQAFPALLNRMEYRKRAQGVRPRVKTSAFQCRPYTRMQNTM